MTVQQDLLPGSYRGVPFLAVNSRVTGGRKDVLHSIPNSNKQNIEDQGLSPRVYSLDIILTTDTAGDFYMPKRDRLLQVIEGGVTGPLVHPWYGLLENMAARSFTVIEEQTAAGDGRLSVIFGVSGTPGTPEVAEVTLSVVDAQATVALQAAAQDIADRMAISTVNPTNYSEAVGKTNDIATAFEENTTFLQVSSDAINDFSSELGDFQADVTQLVKAPQDLADSISSLFSTVNALYTTVEATFDVLRGFFDFGDNDVEIVETTSGLIERKQNNDVLNGNMQAQSNILAYLNAVQIDYQTVNEVDAAADILEVQYQKVIAGGLSDDAKTQITELRVIVQDFFDAQKLTVQQIITVNTPVIPARVMAYQYYGASTLGQNIAELNEDLNVTFIQGPTEIFTE